MSAKPTVQHNLLLVRTVSVSRRSLFIDAFTVIVELNKPDAFTDGCHSRPSIGNLYLVVSQSKSLHTDGRNVESCRGAVKPTVCKSLILALH